MLLVPFHSAIARARIAGGASNWEPDDSSGCLVWLDASDTSTITHSSGNVSAMTDKSPNAYSFSKSGSDNVVTNSVTLNSLNVLDFNGGSGDAYLTVTTDLTGASDAVHWGLVRYVSSNGTNSSWWSYNGGGNDYQLEDTSSGNFNFASTTDIFNCGLETGNWNIVTLELNTTANTAEAFVDGTSISSVAYGTALDETSINFRWFANRAGTVCVNGEGAELGIDTDRTNRQRIEGHLAHKYGLTANLPGGHPYKSSPPT